MARRSRGIEEDLRTFWAQVDKSPHPKGCWIWTGKRDPKGYGYTQYHGKRWATHRLSYILHGRKIEDSRCILHTCDTPMCVQPLHLWPGTQKDNIADMDAKRRRGTIKGQRVGEKHPLAKLHDLQVVEIRKRYAVGDIMQKELAQEYGVTQSAISHILGGVRRSGPNIRRSPAENAAAIRGERHHEGKLTEETVRQFRAMSATGKTLKAITDTYNAHARKPITKQMVWRIIHRKAWTHVE